MIARPILIGCVAMVAALSRAAAAPYCVEQTGIPLQCLYVDPALCQHEAHRVNGRCAANPGEFVTPETALQYCVVESGNVVSCIYPDYTDCERDAVAQGGACVAAIPKPLPTPAPAAGVDPYEVKRP
jgi:hypothetical protein